MSKKPSIKVLATDMDGTFIPLDGNEKNRSDLSELTGELRRNNIALMYVTGRHLDLVGDAIDSQGLPSPPWIICDVGASIYRLEADTYRLLEEYAAHLSEVVGEFDRVRLIHSIGEAKGIRLQEDEKQTRFKVSYYCDAQNLDVIKSSLERRIAQSRAPYQIIASVDPFTGDGLVDFLPTGVSKAFALQWWAQHANIESPSIIFAGDSGNDLAALTAGYRSIVVGNAEHSVQKKAKLAHDAQGWTDRLVITNEHATSGVLEGLRQFVGNA